jgi:hypothetical protein
MYRAREEETRAVSNTDSFINEVTEEVRRERLFALLRRYGWIAILLVLLLVGGAAWNEWRKAQARAEAEARGEALLVALEAGDPLAQSTALDALRSDRPVDSVMALYAAALAAAGADREAARAELDRLAANAGAPQLYRDLATLKSAMLGAGTVAPDARIAALEPLTLPGGAFRALALEQTALAHVEAGRGETAVTILIDLIGAADVSTALQRRAAQMVLALGGTIDAT